MIRLVWHNTLRITALFICFGYLAVLPAHAEQKGAPWVGKHIDGTLCKNPYYIPGGGPFDYRRQQEYAGQLLMVNNAHFTPDVEQLIKGRTGPLMADIDFVLRTFPNHHRALSSSVEYSFRFKKWPKDSRGMPAECYLQRAINYAPLDGVPVRLYGYYMQKKGKYKEALEANEMALRFYPKDVMVRYNTGLILVKLKKFKEAMTYARPLYDAGLTLPGLKNKLVAAGHWKPSGKQAEAIKAFLKATQEAKAVQAAQEKNSESPAAEEMTEAESTIEAEAEGESEAKAEAEAEAEPSVE